MLWASVEMATLTPISFAILQWMSSRSRRSGWALTSMTAAALAGGPHDLLHVHLVGLALADQPAGGMGEDVEVAGCPWRAGCVRSAARAAGRSWSGRRRRSGRARARTSSGRSREPSSRMSTSIDLRSTESLRTFRSAGRSRRSAGAGAPASSPWAMATRSD